jgi:hypothetical protein
MDAKYAAFAEAWAPYVEPDAMAGFYYLMQHFGSVTPVAAADEMTIEPDDVPVSDAIKNYGHLK